MKYQYVCLECEAEFDDPITHEESHGLDTLPFEVMYTCPVCGSEYYVPAVYCDLCEGVILDEYITTIDDDCICENCYSKQRIGD